MVGRSWFVSEESLQLHKANVLQDEAHRNRIQNLRGGVRPSSDIQPESVAGISLPAFITGSAATGIRGLENISLSEKHVSATPSRSVESPISDPEIARSIILGRVLKGAATLLLLALIVGGTASIIGPSTSDTRGSSANASSAFGSVVTFIKDRYASLLALFGHRATVAINENPASDTNLPYSSEGMAVVPSSGSVTADDNAKQSIRNSFSDEVEIYSDQSKSAGVIRPVFKESRGNDYLYVLVPVKGSASSTPP